jgi:hypothetical protein
MTTQAPHDLSHCLTANGIESACVAAFIQSLPVDALPLAAACDHGGFIAPDSVRVSVGRCETQSDTAVVHVGVFFDELIGGCNCSEDPVATPAYVEIVVRVDLASGAATLGPATQSEPVAKL